MITVVIPVYHDDYLSDLLTMLEVQTAKPEKVVVIDNSELGDCSPTCFKKRSFDLDYVPNYRNIGVNASWNLGIERSDSPIVTILNDDVVIPRTLLEQMLFVHLNSHSGFVAPSIAPNAEIPRQWNFVTRTLMAPLFKRIGWCFSIRKTVAEKAGRIPEDLFTFFGDDWFFLQSKLQGWENTNAVNCPVFHYGNGVSAGKHRIELPTTLVEERRVWRRIVSTLL